MTRLIDLVVRALCRLLLGPGLASLFLDDPWQADLFVPEAPMGMPGGPHETPEPWAGAGEFLRA